VALDSSGNIYGTTWLGGVYSLGTVFRLDSSGQETVLHSFVGASDGANPVDGSVLDKAGNLYGATSARGSHFGTLYRIDTSSDQSVLYSFTGGADGAYPYAHLLVDAAGNLFGTASQGGCWTSCFERHSHVTLSRPASRTCVGGGSRGQRDGPEGDFWTIFGKGESSGWLLLRIT